MQFLTVERIFHEKNPSKTCNFSQLNVFSMKKNMSSDFKFLSKARKDDRALSKAIQRYRPSVLKENDQFDVCNNQHFILDKAWDSLKHREETEKMQLETQQLDDELNEMKQKNDVERLALQDLESLLIKRRRRAEKCRRLAESQSSYRALLEKMIGDAVHQ